MEKKKKKKKKCMSGRPNERGQSVGYPAETIQYNCRRDSRYMVSLVREMKCFFLAST